MPSNRVEQWRDSGAFEEVGGHRLFSVRRDGGGPLLLFLHGFPSSSFDWRELLDQRPEHAALAFDFLGFGFSDKPPDHVYSLAWQADAAEELVRRAGAREVFIVAHDMGTSVATELMARDLRGELDMDIAGALLFNGSILLDRASPTPGQRLLRGRAGAVFARLTNGADLPCPVPPHLLARASPDGRRGGRPVGADRPRGRSPHRAPADPLHGRA